MYFHWMVFSVCQCVMHFSRLKTLEKKKKSCQLQLLHINIIFRHFPHGSTNQLIWIWSLPAYIPFTLSVFSHLLLLRKNYTKSHTLLNCLYLLGSHKTVHAVYSIRCLVRNTKTSAKDEGAETCLGSLFPKAVKINSSRIWAALRRREEHDF